MLSQMSQGGGEDEGESTIPPPGGGAPPMQNFPASGPPGHYQSDHVSAQQSFAQNLMDQYLSSGGGYYG